jgi:hypothetical protein
MSGFVDDKDATFHARSNSNPINQVIISNHFTMRQKVNVLVLNICMMILPIILNAETVQIENAQKVVNSYIAYVGKANEFSINDLFAYSEANQIYFYAASLNPAGYMIVSANDDLPPIIAYSFQDDLDANNKFFTILKCDIAHRLSCINQLSPETVKNREIEWKTLINGTYNEKKLFQQWPPEGTTATGGWLETNWTQNPPYNNQCPIDPVTGTRSFAGCPATAMAQILNYHLTTNATRFVDNDDYYHNYAGRTFWIDDDFALHGFPSFQQLNTFLDTLDAHFQRGKLPTIQDKAALTFACGIAATQVYTSEGSGTFGVIQAYEAYQRFGFTTSELLYDSDFTLYTHLAQNVKDSLPAHLAIVDESWSTGHNVVIDGYNTNDYFHVNFGWGGSNNGWYLLPEQMPYNLTVVEGLIVDIMKDESVAMDEVKNPFQFHMYPNPAHNIITIETVNLPIILTISDLSGKQIFSETISKEKSNIDLSGFQQGIYLLKLNNINCVKKLIIMNQL